MQGTNYIQILLQHNRIFLKYHNISLNLKLGITSLFFRAVLNVCFAYTSRDEICAAMREVADGVQLGLIKER